jgi:hypothetical protein
VQFPLHHRQAGNPMAAQATVNTRTASSGIDVFLRDVGQVIQ